VNAWNNEDEEHKDMLKSSLKPHKIEVGMGLDDRSDARSMASESKSVASERSHKSIQDLKTKAAQEKKDWDILSATTKKVPLTLEERIAKHVADEILRGNTQFRHVHSNASVRKLLEKEAHKHLESMKGIAGPRIVENKDHFPRKDYEDPNCLPYLHRNPAI